MTADQDAEALVRWAKSYPFSPPSQSYLLVGTRAMPLNEGDTAAFRAQGRTPVLACGSNASPARLAQKFAALDQPGVIPVLRGRLADFSIVYSAHFSAYGSIPATPQYTPAGCVDVFVTFLDPAQLQRMHQTEALGVNYVFGILRDVQLRLDDGRELNEVFAYASNHGCLCANGSPIALIAGEKGETPVPGMTQAEVQAFAYRLIGDDGPLDTLIAETIADDNKRRRRTAFLRRHASPFAAPPEMWTPIRV